MTIRKKATAAWKGKLETGEGIISTESGALTRVPYGFKQRFEGQAGSNPEELVGAAHAACYSMALSLFLGQNDYVANSIHTEATVSLVKDGDGFKVSQIDLNCEADVPDIEEELFQSLCQETKENCPISKLLNANISLNAKLM